MRTCSPVRLDGCISVVSALFLSDCVDAMAIWYRLVQTAAPLTRRKFFPRRQYDTFDRPLYTPDERRFCQSDWRCTYRILGVHRRIV
jgi:hypothetical protein